MTTSLIIGFDKSENGDNTVLIVGRKTPGRVCEILNAFEGKEAEELYEKLLGKKENKEEK